MTELVVMVEYLIDIIYILCVGNRAFRQSIGIPMGTDYAPLIANLYLFQVHEEFNKE